MARKRLTPEAYLLRLLSSPRSYMQLVRKFQLKGYSRAKLDDLLDVFGVNRQDLDKEFLEALLEGAVRKGKGPLWFRKRAAGLVEGRMLDEYLDREDVWGSSLRVAVECCKKRGLDWQKCRDYIIRQGFPARYLDEARKLYEEV